MSAGAAASPRAASAPPSAAASAPSAPPPYEYDDVLAPPPASPPPAPPPPPPPVTTSFGRREKHDVLHEAAMSIDWLTSVHAIVASAVQFAMHSAWYPGWKTRQRCSSVTLLP